MKHAQDRFVGALLFPCLPFYLVHRRTIASDSALSSAANVSPRVPSDWWKLRARARGGWKRGDGHLCAFAVYRRELWWLSRARSSSETVERTPKGKRLEPSRIIRLGEQSVEVGCGRHVRPDSNAVYPTALCRKTRPNCIKERRRKGEGRKRKRDIYPPKNRIHSLNLAVSIVCQELIRSWEGEF